MRPWNVYMVECSNGHVYTGITTNIQRRLEQHNGLRKGGARYTRMHRPVFLTFLEKYPTRSTASKREYEIKHLSLPRKRALMRKQSKDDFVNAL